MSAVSSPAADRLGGEPFDQREPGVQALCDPVPDRTRAGVVLELGFGEEAAARQLARGVEGQPCLVQGPEPAYAPRCPQRRPDHPVGHLFAGPFDGGELQLLLGPPVREQPGLADAEPVGELAEGEPVEPGLGGERDGGVEHRRPGALTPDRSTVDRHDRERTTKRPIGRIVSGSGQGDAHHQATALARLRIDRRRRAPVPPPARSTARGRSRAPPPSRSPRSRRNGSKIVSISYRGTTGPVLLTTRVGRPSRPTRSAPTPSRRAGTLYRSAFSTRF